MSSTYLDRDQVPRNFEGIALTPGVLDSTGRLRAYALVPPIGDAFLFSLILGHAADLRHGTMYLLVSEVKREPVQLRDRIGAR